MAGYKKVTYISLKITVTEVIVVVYFVGNGDYRPEIINQILDVLLKSNSVQLAKMFSWSKNKIILIFLLSEAMNLCVVLL